MSIANYFETLLLKSLRNESPAVATVYVKLHKGDPGEEGTANAAGESTRKQVTFTVPASGVTKNSALIEWPAVSTAETISHVSLWDHVSAGNCLWTGSLSASKTLAIGDNLLIKAEQLSVSLD